ncbi:hypothetical protein EYC80_009617 [Monilinia laxa]|uniref:Uncharacterized protein n=1 Tax=Monilinia laxa TaxID=61186 RepID=A0A5N6JYG3_MONLA|nr:hypothetical protein EYC80_009617 [Monilinia laxa]
MQRAFPNPAFRMIPTKNTTHPISIEKTAEGKKKSSPNICHVKILRWATPQHGSKPPKRYEPRSIDLITFHLRLYFNLLHIYKYMDVSLMAVPDRRILAKKCVMYARIGARVKGET